MKPVENAKEPYITQTGQPQEQAEAEQVKAEQEQPKTEQAEQPKPKQEQAEQPKAEQSAEKASAEQENDQQAEPKAEQAEAPTDATVVAHGSLYPQGFDADALPDYAGKKYVIINDGKPYFTADDRAKGKEEFELYSALDELGRCGTAYANICPALMPAEKRGDISEIHPTGWKQQRYDGIVDADPPYLYNRSHLIAYKLAGENANKYNLITGTRYFNAEGMSYVEDRVAEYVRDTGHHVLYRITPVFENDELLARGVLMEAESLEDDRVRYCEFVYNVQPGVYIDYSDGSNRKE